MPLPLFGLWRETRLKLGSDFSQIIGFLENNQIEVLPFNFIHLQKLLALEYHHRDPFDRIIIAQALTENLTIISKDENFPKYTEVLCGDQLFF